MRLIFSRAAVHDLVRLREFIARHNPDATKRVSQRLRGAIKGLVNNRGDLISLLVWRQILATKDFMASTSAG